MTLEILANPLILTGAWQRVKHWYQFDELRPEPEFSDWYLNTEDRLEQLMAEFRANSYQPKPFTVVPYPKSGATLRHFVVPSVRDQVAFTAIATVLAPFLDARMPNFSFGNRWHRGLFWQNDMWKLRPFALQDNKVYQPIRRGHGLFRRVCHWSAARMVNTTPESNTRTKPSLNEHDYPQSMLPPYIRLDWWSSRHRSNHPTVSGYWAQLDLQMAYPSVNIDLLKQRLQHMLQADPLFDSAFSEAFNCITSISEIYGHLQGYPGDLSVHLTLNEDLRLKLADDLCGLLGSVEYDATAIGHDFWLPPHADQKLPRSDGQDHKGLPTGLLISGLLMNVYLHCMDVTMGQWLLRTKDKAPAAFARFSDDMIILTTEPYQLFAGIDEIWHGITELDSSTIHAPSNDADSNLRINWSKLQPKGLSKIAETYLKDGQFQECPDCKRLYVNGNTGSQQQKFLEWWQTHRDQSEIHLKQGRIDTNRLGPFVTHIVERLSSMGQDDAFQRFDRSAKERLGELHELVRVNIDDRQVREDTRLFFAASRLSKAWLPDETSFDDIAQMMLTLKEALFRTPWKFQLWDAIVKVACRRPPLNESATHDESTKWLKGILGIIAAHEDIPEA